MKKILPLFFICFLHRPVFSQKSVPDFGKIDAADLRMLRAPDTTFFFKRIFSSDPMHILLSETFEVRESIFEKESYPGIKEFFAKAYALMEEEIVLKKKN